jgi:hypothetical protein
VTVNASPLGSRSGRLELVSKVRRPLCFIWWWA